jgi:hypothetical protein
MTSASIGYCAKCKEHFSYLVPLHGDKGGAMCCLTCVGAWHAQHGVLRNRGRIAIRAMRSFRDAGGSAVDLNKLVDTVIADGFLSFDPLGYLHDIAKGNDETIELTSELLTDVLTLIHPDHQPPERRELAQSITTRLLSIKPFVFPEWKKKLESPPPWARRNTSMTNSDEDNKEVLQEYPCPTCRSTVPYFYCTACDAEWKRRKQEERERECAKNRHRYATKRQRQLQSMPARRCSGCCQLMAKERRRHIKYCSAACRIKAHRRGKVGG